MLTSVQQIREGQSGSLGPTLSLEKQRRVLKGSVCELGTLLPADSTQSAVRGATTMQVRCVGKALDSPGLIQCYSTFLMKTLCQALVSQLPDHGSLQNIAESLYILILFGCTA